MRPEKRNLRNRWHVWWSFDTRARAGLTLTEVLVIIAVLVVLALIAVPRFLGNRAYQQETNCIYNLSSIADAKQMWAMETNAKKVGEKTDEHGKRIIIMDIAGEANTDGQTVSYEQLRLYLGRELCCPSAGAADRTFERTYLIMPTGQDPTCRINPKNHVLANGL